MSNKALYKYKAGISQEERQQANLTTSLPYRRSNS